jgi:hypothetical protein
MLRKNKKKEPNKKGIASIDDLTQKTKFKGGSINKIYLSDNETDSSDSDCENKTKELKKILKHLKSHINNPKEKKDPKDLIQAKEILKLLNKK